MTDKILCVVHHEKSDVGVVADCARALGAEIEIRQPTAGDSLPAPEETARAVIFGGAMSANDDHDPVILGELRWVEGALRSGTPLIGICLGAQMIGRVNGAEISPRANGEWEIGYRRVIPSADGSALFESCASFFQWHREGFDLPSGATRLAAGDQFPEQAYSIGSSVFGFQFHPEVGRAQLRRWHEEFADEMDKPGADRISVQQEDDVRLRPAAEGWLMQVMTKFLALPR